MNPGKPLMPFSLLLMALLTLTLAGCGGGGGDGTSPPPPPAASIAVQPGSFDFGLVTEGNLDSVPARRFSIRNTGDVSYSVQSIRLEGVNPTDFILDSSTGTNACGLAVVALNPGESCDVSVRFSPRNFGTYNAALVVQSSDPVAPLLNSPVEGTYAEVLAIDVSVNQVNACPREVPAEVFVSVTDQGGFPIRDLGLPDFSLQELGSGVALNSVESVASAGSSISVSVMMDYSNTITSFPDVVASMEEAAGILVQELGASDEADIVKFSFNPKFMLDDFSSDQALLLEAISTDPALPGGSRFYDALVAVVERTKSRTKDRKAIIALTDGNDSSTVSDLGTAIGVALEEDIPVFTMGFGNVRAFELGKLAADTGGIFYEVPASDNLSGIYKQLSNLLFADQYVLTYQSGVPADATATVAVSVEFMRDGKIFEGTGSKTMRVCP